MRKLALGSFRLALIAGAMLCLFRGSREVAVVSADLLLSQSQAVLPAAHRLGAPKDGFFPVLDESEALLGWATTTFPEAEEIQGYAGPSELFVLLDAERKVLAAELVRSADTSGHVSKVVEKEEFWRQWTGKSETQIGSSRDYDIVSGATLTSEAMARGVAARFGGEDLDQWFPQALGVAAVQRWYPGADGLAGTGREGASAVSKGGEQIGTVLRSSRMGVLSRGFNGVSDVLLALSQDEETILGVGLLASRDNEPYVKYVQEELLYADGFAGKSVASVIDPDDPPLIVSGASVTAGAVLLSVEEMLGIYFKEDGGRAFAWKPALALAWIALGLFSGFNKRAGKARARMAFAVVSVAAGLTLGWMLSQDQLVGWGRHGLSPNLALPLLVLTAVALLVPAFTGKNVYCSRLCPHGAAQSLLGAVVKKRWVVRGRVHRALQKVPWLTLLVIWIIALAGASAPFAQAEPFEIWSSGFYALVPAAILTIGLIAAVFLPQAYCHYGCPTGALLKFLSHSPASWTRRDTIATVLVVVAAGWTLL